MFERNKFSLDQDGWWWRCWGDRWSSGVWWHLQPHACLCVMAFRQLRSAIPAGHSLQQQLPGWQHVRALAAWSGLEGSWCITSLMDLPIVLRPGGAAAHMTPSVPKHTHASAIPSTDHPLVWIGMCFPIHPLIEQSISGSWTRRKKELQYPKRPQEGTAELEEGLLGSMSH